MKLTNTAVLEGVAMALRDQISPRLDDSFAAEAARMAQSLIRIVALAGDDAVVVRVRDRTVESPADRGA